MLIARVLINSVVLDSPVQSLESRIETVPRTRVFGRVASVEGLKVEVEGAGSALGLGTELEIELGSGRRVSAEVVGLSDTHALALTLGNLDGIKLGARAFVSTDGQQIAPSQGWLGRIVDGLGRPIDGKGALPHGEMRSLGQPRCQRTYVVVSARASISACALSITS